jgi:putative heme-binding domain-containing protein
MRRSGSRSRFPAGAHAAFLDDFFETPSPGLRRAFMELFRVTGTPSGVSARNAVRTATAEAANREADEHLRADAIRLLAMMEPASHAALFRQMIDPQEPAPVQREAVRALAQLPGDEVGAFLLANWSTMTPEIRDEAINAFMRERSRVRMLLDAMENQVVHTSSIGWARSVNLMRDWDGEERDRARALLSERPGEREAIVQHYQAALRSPGDRTRGQQVFASACGPCHQIAGQDGIAFGPDLATVRHWSPQALVAKILMPNRAILDGYELWMLEQSNGRTISGVISSETPTSITLRDASGTETIVLRTEIASLSATNVSAMPSGLEHQIDLQQMADLIAFLKQNR